MSSKRPWARCDICGHAAGLPLTPADRETLRFARWITAACKPCRARQKIKPKPPAKRAA